MQIAINAKNEIVSYATFGKLQNGIECFVELPSDFIPQKYIWVPSETETNNYIYHIIDNEETDKKYGNFILNPDYEMQILLPRILEAKIAELSEICTSTIYRGTDITLSDGTIEHFTLDDHDQANLLGLGMEIVAGAEQVSWHTDDKHESCKYYSAQDAMTIIQSLTVYKSYHITYFRDLRIYVNTLTSVSDINNISYGYPLPEEYKSQVLKDLEKKMLL